MQSEGNKFINVAYGSGCTCPGDTLTYECTVMELEAIIWNGTALDCPHSSHNEIVLFHFDPSDSYSSCNNGTIVARVLSVEGNNYTSQLNVTVTPDTAGRTIACLQQSGNSIITHFSSVVPQPGLCSKD